MAKERVLVLCSGGLNSAVTATIASHEHSLAMLHVRFGHRAAAKEAELFEKQADFYGADKKMVVELPHFAMIGGNGRVQWVKVNNKRSGSLYRCVKRAMSRIQFPKFDGKRTRGTLPL